jgi:hypothetical protein
MTKHTILGSFGPSDRISIPKSEGEVSTVLTLVTPKNELSYGIGNAIENLASMGLLPSEIGIDLMILAAHIYAADTRISRKSESQDGWTREMRMVVPVSDPKRWKHVAELLQRMLNFLTGDRWAFSFRSRPFGFSLLAPARLRLKTPVPIDRFSLFSGGLDSLIGAIDLLDNGAIPLLISHAADGSSSTAQTACFNELKARYNDIPFNRFRVTMSFPADLVQQVGGPESSTRGRSFLFFTIGVLAGTGLNKKFTIIAPENGVIAINVPLDPLRLGALSTRTMHPFYIARWNELLSKLEIPGNIENPYWKCTKGEMVVDCANQDLLRRLIPLTMSCSSPSKGRWQKHGIENCGYCLPCLIRRAALERAYGRDSDPTHYYLSNLAESILNPRKAEGQQIRSFQFALERLRENPNLAQLLIYKPGPLSDLSRDDIVVLAGVYQRGMNEVDSLLANVQTRPHSRQPL